jgi:hypothetical protein
MQSYNFILIWLNHATKYKVFDTYRYVLFGAISHAIGLFFGGECCQRSLFTLIFPVRLDVSSRTFGIPSGGGGALHPVL